MGNHIHILLFDQFFVMAIYLTICLGKAYGDMVPWCGGNTCCFSGSTNPQTHDKTSQIPKNSHENPQEIPRLPL